jgi:hypothetical protein
MAQEVGVLVGHGSGVGLGLAWPEGQGSLWWWCIDQVWSCGLAQPEGQRARQSGAAALQAYRVGTWQAGCSFIRLWCGEASHDLRI